MPTLAAIRGAIKGVLAAVPNVGVVNDYERYAQRNSELKAAYIGPIDGQDVLLGWNIRRVATDEKPLAATEGGRYVVTHTWRLRGYMAIQDAAGSEKEFDTLIEAVRAAFRANLSLGGLVSSTETRDQAGIRVEESEPVLFADVLCHAVRLSLRTIHYE
jgi:hypothetical protein